MITVIGDLILDEYVYAKKTRKSPEQPNADVLLVDRKEYYLGGAANVALNLLTLGKQTSLLTSIANDEYSAILTNLLYSNSINVFNSINKSGRNTVKTRVFDGSNYVVRLDSEKPVECSEDYFIKTLRQKKSKITIISDYNKGTIQRPKDIIKQADSIVLVDPKKPFEEYEGANILKANKFEFETWYGKELTSEIQLTKAVKDLDIDTVIITLGSNGCVFTSKSFKSRGYLKSPKVEVKSVIGAGDSFIAGLAYGLANNQLLPDAIITANKVASISVTKEGTSNVRESEIIWSSK